MRRISPKGVIAGTIVDLVTTNVALLPVALIVYAQVAKAGMTHAEENAAFTNAFAHNSPLYAMGLSLGCMASVLGGWTAAKVARQSEVLNGALSAVGCVGLGVYGWIATHSSIPVWQHLSFILLSPALGALGGIIRVRQIERLPSGDVADGRSDLEVAPIISNGSRWLYIANRALTVVFALAAFFFGSVGVYGYNRHETTIVFGSAFICAFGIVAMTLFLIAARMMRSGRAHLALHLSGLVIGSIPFVVMIVGLVIQHAG
jgi:hypothetical protein